MKALKSIKWRLQIWHSLVLFIVLAALGVTAYQLERARLFGRVDDELQKRFPPVASALRGPPRGPPPDDAFPDEDRPPPPRRAGFHLPPQAIQFFGASDPHDYYYLVKDRRGHELGRSTNTSHYAFFHAVTTPWPGESAPPLVTPHMPAPPPPRTIAEERQIAHFLPSGETVIIGCSIAPELRELRSLAWKLVAAGGVILLFGLAGGAWMASRAMLPIAHISAAAARISSGDLSRRIDVAETESELGQLAAVLNGTFARLEAAFTQQQQFTSDAAHELRTPVSVMLTQTQAALQRERVPAEYREALAACERAAQRMRRLIASLLELARLDAGQELAPPVQCDLAAIVNECIDLVRPLARQKNVQILPQTAPAPVLADPDRLGRALTNLLTNAIQYNRDGGEVRIHLAASDGGAALIVTDTGVGIAPEHLPHVFERFYRADRSRSGDAPHAGLGLAIAKSIIESHGGTISASSTPGAGATFTLHLPLAPALAGD
jgi:heavy metal sensor kinase